MDPKRTHVLWVCRRSLLAPGCLLMVGPKGYLTPEQYQLWLERHIVVERARKQRLKLEKNPIRAAPVEQRRMPQTFSIEEAFWHYPECKCGSCDCELARRCKMFRATLKPRHTSKSLGTRLPELAHPVQARLLAVVEAFLSTQG